MASLNKKLPQIKKSLKGFLSEEEGKISKKNIGKMTGAALGLGLAVGAGITILSHTPGASAACTHTSHTSHSSHGLPQLPHFPQLPRLPQLLFLIGEK